MRVTQEAEWDKAAVEVPEEWLQGIETGWLESKSSRAGTADKAMGGGNRELPPAKKTVKVLQVGKAALFMADTMVLDGPKWFPAAMTDSTGDTVRGKACEGVLRICRSPWKWGPGN